MHSSAPLRPSLSLATLPPPTVFRPSNTTAQDKLPVMVWLYGGSFEYGGSSFILYDGSALARLGKVIVVTVNYR